jgi:hypothetical protein
MRSSGILEGSAWWCRTRRELLPPPPPRVPCQLPLVKDGPIPIAHVSTPEVGRRSHVWRMLCVVAACRRYVPYLGRGTKRTSFKMPGMALKIGSQFLIKGLSRSGRALRRRLRVNVHYCLTARYGRVGRLSWRGRRHGLAAAAGPRVR